MHLSELFRHKNTSPSPSVSHINSDLYNTRTLSQQNFNNSTKSIYQKDQQRPTPLDFTISKQGIKKITYDSMQDQIAWFQTQNLIECGIKMLIICIFLFLAHIRSLISLNTVLTIFIFTFLLISLHHHIFGAFLVRTWAYLSLIGSTFVLSHQFFISIINKISPIVASQLYYTYHSLIPATYITVMIVILYNSLPLLTYSSPHSIILTIFSYPRTLFEFLRIIQRLKYAILQAYAIMLILTLIGQLILDYNSDNVYQLQEFFGYILHPHTMLAQIIIFLTISILIHFIIKVISNGVSEFLINILYNKKNIEKTKLPIILQFLKASQNDTFWINRNNSSNIVSIIGKILKIDFLSNIQYQNKLTRLELQNIYKHSLIWLRDLVFNNPNALNTNISCSKFYNTYYDLFKEFSQFQMQKCSNSLFQLSIIIDNYNIFRSKGKGIRQDLFYWFKIGKKQYQIWNKAIQCCSLLQITDLIIQIYELGEIGKQAWILSGVGISMRQINQRAQKLSDNHKLNPAIRQKMRQYIKKTNKMLKIN